MKKYMTFLFAILMASLALSSCTREGGDDPTSVGGFDANGASNALFSVSPTLQVHFSKGNMQYQASTGTWRFAEHQYDFIGENNDHISPTYSGWIDLFGWGTSGWNSGAANYQPFCSSTQSVAYCPGGSSSNPLSGAFAEADWAWHNAIINGGGAAHSWRTLSKDEWDYLISGRPNAASKCGYAIVDTIHGFVILPDNWTMPSGLSFIPGTNGTNVMDFSNCSTYSLTDWVAMENAGAVFLPAAGFRISDSITDNVNHSCYYWTTTPNDTVRACYFVARPNMHHTSDEGWRLMGFSVRPVKN